MNKCLELDDWFNTTYEQLVDYKEKHGNFDGIMSEKMPVKFRRNITRIRQAKRSTDSHLLSKEMIDKLEGIGFPWWGKISWFNQMWLRLNEYKAIHGGFHNNASIKDLKLVRERLINYYKKGRMSNDMIDQLESIGFSCDFLTKQNDLNIG